MDVMKLRKIVETIRKLSAIFGLVLLVIIFTVGRTNEALQPKIATVVQSYTYFVIFLLIIEAFLKYIDKRRTK